jgi:hypothetical protein
MKRCREACVTVRVRSWLAGAPVGASLCLTMCIGPARIPSATPSDRISIKRSETTDNR